MKFKKYLRHIEFRVYTLYTALPFLPPKHKRWPISPCVLFERPGKNKRSEEILIGDSVKFCLEFQNLDLGHRIECSRIA